LLWLALRSGAKPRRITYPCQQAAAANSFGFLAYLAALFGSATLLHRLKVAFSPSRLLLFGLGLLLTVSLHGSVVTPATPLYADSPDLPAWTSPSALSNVFAITNVPEPQHSLNDGVIPLGVSPEEALHDDGIDALVDLMQANGDYFYQTAATPGGLFGSDDVVVIKISNQWGHDGARSGTNTDVVKGIIYRLVQHPDGFTGAVIIAENAQGRNPNVMDASTSNSQFQDQSYDEVADAFSSQGYHVCTIEWDGFRTNIVDDFDQDDVANGYVLMDADETPEEQDHGRLSYPKFQVNCSGMNLSVSMRQGIWNGSAFDNDRLKMINLPVLKRHNSAWATIAVKNYLGFITTCNGSECSTNILRWVSPGEKHCWILGPSDNGMSCSGSDYSPDYGLVARQMARIRRADLNIVDAIWVNPRSNGSWESEVRRQDVVLASRDAFAADYYASEFILGPLIRQMYGDGSGYEQAMASTHGGWFRNIQLWNATRLRDEGITDNITMDDGMTRDDELAQFNAYVADLSTPAAPTLTLLAPNGGEEWIVDTQQQIQWSSTNLEGDVRLEYSTDNFVSANVIADSTPNDGAYTWTVPNDPSSAARVRVSSVLTGTINDTSNAVFTIAPAPLPTLTLLIPNGGEKWQVGTQQQIQWSSTNLEGDVRLEYSTDGFVSANVIADSTSNDGAYTWTVPNALSHDVLVRVSSTLVSTATAKVSDTSDAPFTIAGPHTFEDSHKRVSRVILREGETVTYSIVLYEEVNATLTLSDTFPVFMTYVPGSANIEPASKGPLSISDGIYWSGTVTGTQPVTITFQAQAPTGTGTAVLFILNRAQISRNGATPIERVAHSYLNGFHMFLPLVIKNH
jgi:uncharacterized protein (DUF362 family)